MARQHPVGDTLCCLSCCYANHAVIKHAMSACTPAGVIRRFASCLNLTTAILAFNPTNLCLIRSRLASSHHSATASSSRRSRWLFVAVCRSLQRAPLCAPGRSLLVTGRLYGSILHGLSKTCIPWIRSSHAPYAVRHTDAIANRCKDGTQHTER